MKFLHQALACLALVSQVIGQGYFLENIKHQGIAPYNPGGVGYQVFRNVKDFGAKGDGATDDTAAINAAIKQGARCVPGPAGKGGCASSTTSPAIVYFPAGTYIISAPIVSFYMTHLHSNPNNLAVLKASSGFSGFALVDADPYDCENQDYRSTNVFYRQIRNVVLDSTSFPAEKAMNLVHWPTAQATSLQNVVFRMSEAPGNKHVGLFIENGSGGFLTDLVFHGGEYGMNIGSQQFTTRNLQFFNCQTAINQLWDWGWAYMGLSINNCGVGLNMSAGGSKNQAVGSVIVIDSHVSNTPIAFTHDRTSTSSPKTGGSLVLENVLLSNVPIAVQEPAAHLDGNRLITSFVSGHAYDSKGPSVLANATLPFSRPGTLVDQSKNYYTRSKPQYQNIPTSQFASVRDAGARGDGRNDDTAALQNIINSATAAGKIVFFDTGMYKVMRTLRIPPGAKIVGEAYPVIFGSGTFFQNTNEPVPVVQVGAAGENGIVEWSDMVVSTQGPCAGAILIQWNLASPANTPSGMWDVHTRIGGFAGSDLQIDQCPTTAQQPQQKCIAAFQSMEVAITANGLYMENVWLWSADHDIEEPKNSQITVYSGRGLSIESQVGNIWLIGTAVEHHVLYQYQLVNTQNIFMGFIQTETPYYQPVPFAPTPFTVIPERHDPDFGVYCRDKDVTCNDAWGARIVSSKDIMVYGAGFYNFFNNYSTACTAHPGDDKYSANCQTQIFGIDTGGLTPTSGSSVYVYGLNTVGVVSMIEFQGNSIAKQEDNTNGYAESIIMFNT